MSIAQVEITGTLQADGTLVLDEKPALPPGKVRVIVRTTEAAAVPGEDWWEFLQRTRKELEASGFHFLNEQEMEARLRWLRGGSDEEDPAPGETGE